MQLVNRDTYKFAMKCSAAEVDGKWVDVFKQPVTDTGKKSKCGRITLATTEKDTVPFTVQISSLSGPHGYQDLMHTVYENGPVAESYESFDVIRERANSSIV